MRKEYDKIIEKAWMFLKNCRDIRQRPFSTQKNEWSA